MAGGVYVNPANAVTASRIFTLPPFLYFVANGMYQWAVVMVIINGVADLVDGAVARAFNCTSGFGELFDAISDAISMTFFLVVALAYDLAPWEPVALIVGLGAVNTVMRAIYVKRAGRATNYQSFAMEKTVGFLAYVCGFAVAQYEVSFYFWSAAVIMIVVLLHDTKRMLFDPVPGVGSLN